MAEILNEDYGNEGKPSSVEVSNELGSLPSEALAEWRLSEQVENGTPSTSLAFWDTDDDEDGGTKPSELYGKFTWKIENFSQINKRELRGSAFEVGGYKWYILIYPQGCDVSNHLSLFLCVANHDKFLPGWSHFAQFTIAVVNKDPKKSKHSDTLHRFCKKEHDWGWKKFLELSKLSDGYIVQDALTIRAQVQVIREKADRPFRCLDYQYRKELFRVYLENLNQICHRFIDERRGKVSKFIEDKVRWSSFCSFWSGIDQKSKKNMSKEKTGVVLKIIVKHFFIEKEVTSTLVMDSLYCGLKALEFQSKNKMLGTKSAELDHFPAPFVLIEKDMFVLTDDIVPLLERVSREPSPHAHLPPKDDKGSHYHNKDGSSGEEFIGDSIVFDERHLTELGRSTVETYVLAHIFSTRIEAAYQEVVALKRQEELIREEEAAWQAENQLKARRAADKEKRAKKKQAKYKKNSRRGKDKGGSEKSDLLTDELVQEENPLVEKFPDEFSPKNCAEIPDVMSKVEVSDESDRADIMTESLLPISHENDTNIIISDTDASEIQPNIEMIGPDKHKGLIERSRCVMDDSSSTCSTDSMPPHSLNESPIGGKSQEGKEMLERACFVNIKGTSCAGDLKFNCDSTAISSAKEVVRLDEEPHVMPLQERALVCDLTATEKPLDRKIAKEPSLCSPREKHTDEEPFHNAESSSTSPATLRSEKSIPNSSKSQIPFFPKTETQKFGSPSKNVTVDLVSCASRHISLVPVHSVPGQLCADPSPSSPNHPPPLSYRNAITGNVAARSNANPSVFSHPSSSSTNKTVASELHQIHPWKDDSCHKLGGNGGGSNPSGLFEHNFGIDTDVGPNRSSVVSSSQAPAMFHDEFPHLDIINDLLDEEQGVRREVGGSNLNQHLSFSRQYLDVGLPSSSAMLELPGQHHYDESFQRAYVPSSSSSSSSGLPIELMSPHHWEVVDPDGWLVQNPWPYSGGGDASMRNPGRGNTNGYLLGRGFGGRFAARRSSNRP